MSAKSKRRSSSSSRSSGLDVMADRISDIMHRSNKKVAASLEPTANKAKEIKSALSNTPRQVNAVFKKGLGKQSKDSETSKSSKRKRTSSLNASNNIQVNVSQNILSYTTDDLVDAHAPRSHSTQSLYYKRLVPKRIVQLRPGDEIVIVIPPITSTTKEDAKTAIEDVTTNFKRIMLDTCTGLHYTQKEEQYQHMKKKHEIIRDNQIALEFPARVKNYPERIELENVGLPETVINAHWNGDAGINVELCRYSKRMTALLRLRSIPYIEIYKLVSENEVLDDLIKFPTVSANHDGLADPLIKNLWEVKGCVVSTIEVLMKYYRASSNCKQIKLDVMQKSNDKYKESDTVKEDTRIANDTQFLIKKMKEELSEEKLYSFANYVDSIYENKYRQKYSTFTYISEKLLSDDEIEEMYTRFKTEFPSMHSILAVTVSSRYDAVLLAIPLVKNENEKDTVDETNDIDEGESNELSRSERATLEYFLAMIRIRSQKQLKHWSMLSPLAHHCKGFRQPGQKSMHNAAACTLKTAWNECDKLFEECTPARKEEIDEQPTLSSSFDNWQRQIPKVYQTDGKSSVYLRGTAYYIKKDKTFILPIGTIMKSPLEIRFTITSCVRHDIYYSVITGTILDKDSISTTPQIKTQIEAIQNGGVMWPKVGWIVESMPGFDDCKDLEYVDQYIPAPLRARVPKAATTEDILFRAHPFCNVSDTDSRVYTTDEHYENVIRFQRLIELNSFRLYLRDDVHAWEDEVALQKEEELSDNEGKSPDDSHQSKLPPNMRRDREKEETFVESMSQASKELYRVNKYQSDTINHINPYSKDKDKFYHFPLCPREETSNEGMMLTSATLNESLGLIEKTNNASFKTCKNTSNRNVFLYGDALSVSNHSKLSMNILRKLTEIGKEDYVKTHIEALDRIVIQKGLFHQQMHQCGVIYSLFYGSFIQPMQVANGVKRVMGDPVKGNYQDHDKFLLKLYKSCRRYRHRCFINSLSLLDLNIRDDETPRQFVCRIESLLVAFENDWENTRHEPSRLVSLFMKYTKSYLRCKYALRKRDFWLLEKESCEWMAAWKIMNKPIYLREQCEQIEALYDQTFQPWLREIMRMNRICVLTDSKSGMAFDEVCELYNLHLKIPPSSSSLDVDVKRSTHIMLGRSCANEIFNAGGTKSGSGTSEEADVIQLESVLCNAGIFSTKDEVIMDNNYFWKVVQRPTNVGSEIDRQKEKVELTDHEKKLHDYLIKAEDQKRDYDEVEVGGEDDDCISTVSSSMESVGEKETADVNGDDDDEVLDELTEEEKVEKATSALKSLGNIKRKPYNKLAIKDIFVAGKTILKKVIKKKRKKILENKRKRMQLIHLAVKSFKKRMAERRGILNDRIEKSSTESFTFEPQQFELDYRTIMIERRRNGSANV